MSDAERQFFRSVAERDPPARRVSELWCVVGRGGGKDSVASATLAHGAALFDRHDKVRPGERPLAMCLACDRDQARIVLNYTRSYFQDIPPLKEMVVRETMSGFELDNGIDVAIATNNFRSVRGRSILIAVLDECAFYRDEGSSTPDEETYRALKPGLARVPDSVLVGISTPYRKTGLLYRKFCDHYGRDDDDVLVVRGASNQFNPLISQATIDKEIEADPAGARAEWLAEFRNDISGWATRDLIEAAVDHGVTARPPRRGVAYQSFCDASGGVRDSFAAAVAHVEDRTAVLDCLVEIRAPFNPDAATAQVADVLKSYACRSTTGDRYAALWTVEAFRKCGIRYEQSERDRSSIYLDALPLFTTGRARLLDNKRLVSQFAGLERRTNPIGKDRVDHGPSGADDLCNAAAGAMVLAASRRMPLIIPDAVLERARRPAPRSYLLGRVRAVPW